MLISYLVTTYRRPAMLEQCLNSLRAQTDERFEVLVADDHSNDPRTDALITEFAAETSKLAFYWNSQVDEEVRASLVRYAVNINKLATQARGDVYMYLCDDVELYPQATREILDFFTAHPEANAGYIGQDLYDADWETGRVDEQGRRVRGNPAYGEPLRTAFCVVDHSQVVHRREWFQDWPTDAAHWHHADGMFFDDLILRAGPLYPIGDPVHVPLVRYKITASSICRQDVPAALKLLRGAA